MTILDLPCIHRGERIKEGIFECQKHARCSLEFMTERLMPCVICNDRWETGGGNKLIGDIVHTALQSVGLTSSSVQKWLGAECNCSERQAKLNQLHAWAVRTVKGKVDNAKKYLMDILGETSD